MNPQETLPKETRAQKWRTAIVLLVVWVFLFAVVGQNITRQTTPSAPAFVPHTLLVYVTQDNQVYTMESGVALAHIPFATCASQTIVLKTSDHAPSVESVAVDWMPVLKAYRFTVNQAFYINSSNIGIQVVMQDGESIDIGIHCPKQDTESHYLMLFVQNNIVYLADASSGTSAPLFALEPTCELVWNTGDRLERAYPWEMSTPVISGQGNLPEGSVVAFAFSVDGEANLTLISANTVEVWGDHSKVAIYSDCNTPLLTAPHKHE